MTKISFYYSVMIQEADMISFASFTMPAQLESGIQRLCAITHPVEAKYSTLLLPSYLPNIYNGVVQ